MKPDWFIKKFSRIPNDLEADFRRDVIARAKELGVFKKGMYSKTEHVDTRNVTIKLFVKSEAGERFVEFVKQRALILGDIPDPL